MRLLLYLCALLALMAPTAWACDIVKLKDGSLVEGTITREKDGHLWVTQLRPNGTTEVVFVTADTVQSFTLDGIGPLYRVPPLPAPAPGAQKAVVVTLGGEGAILGVHTRASDLKEMLPLLTEELGDDCTGVLILRIEADGAVIGTTEIEALAGVIHEQFKPRFRVVGWVDRALNAAVLPVFAINDFVYTKYANFGLTSHGSLTRDRPLSERWTCLSLERHILRAAKLSEMGGHSPKFLRAMMLNNNISASRDELGRVTFVDDPEKGDIRLSSPGMCLNAKLAESCGFSLGIADTLQELAQVLGFQRLDWVGDRTAATRDRPWPVCKAEVLSRARWSVVDGRVDQLTRHLATLVTADHFEGADAKECRAALEAIKGIKAADPALAEWFFADVDEALTRFERTVDRLSR
jgi:hypothetical protein